MYQKIRPQPQLRKGENRQSDREDGRIPAHPTHVPGGVGRAGSACGSQSARPRAGTGFPPPALRGGHVVLGHQGHGSPGPGPPPFSGRYAELCLPSQAPGLSTCSRPVWNTPKILIPPRPLPYRSKTRTKKEAVTVALEEYLRLRRSEELASLLGTFDQFMDRKELNALRGNS